MKRTLFFLIFALACFCAFADTDVSGSQSGTWNLAGSPYNVIGDITIPSGSDLLIMPGVQVVVMGDYQITAEGTLTATGTEADSIFFYNGQAIPEALWGGIRLENEVQTSNIQFCYIEKAEIGINSINSPANISYNRFTLNEKALQLYGIGDPDPATVQVDYNIVEYSIQNGIMVSQNSNGVIENNEIRYNGTGTQYRGAIQLSNQSQGGYCSPLIQNNHIHHNFKQGITAWDIYGDNGIHPEILDNVIEHNLTGIYLLNSSGYVADNVIRYNFITGDANSGAGVMVAGGTSVPYFERNEIYGNFTGFYLGNNAQPCLGNLDIYHAWAQGENEIYDNIDESNTLHSVYCYSYTTPGMIIKAENNYWGTDDPAEIALGIHDQNDSASLPLVDFEPYLTGQDETLVNGTITYNGVFTLTNHRIQFVSQATGDVFQELTVDPNQPFSYSLDLTEGFYVVVLADAEGTDQTQFGSPGGLLDPTVFYPDPTDPINVGAIEIQDTLPPRYQEVGAPMDIEGQLCHPVYNSFFVYYWEYINWLYQDGDYLYIRRHTRYDDALNTDYDFPVGTVWDKIENVGYNDTWTRTEIVDDSGTIRQSDVVCKLVSTEPDNPDNQYMLLIQRNQDDDALLSNRLHSDDLHRIYHHADGMVLRCEDIVTDVQGYHLVEGNLWEFHPLPPYFYPTFLSYDYIEHDLDNTHLTLYWQGPMDDGTNEWTNYRLCNSGQTFTEVPFMQNYWHTEELMPGNYYLTVRATDGTNESPCSNGVSLIVVSADDPAATPPALSIQPNPASLSRNGGLEILIKSGRALKGRIDIHNLRGQLVRSIPVSSPGDFFHRWDLRDDGGSLCSSGIYFLKVLIKGEESLLRRLAVMK